MTSILSPCETMSSFLILVHVFYEIVLELLTSREGHHGYSIEGHF